MNECIGNLQQEIKELNDELQVVQLESMGYGNMDIGTANQNEEELAELKEQNERLLSELQQERIKSTETAWLQEKLEEIERGRAKREKEVADVLKHNTRLSLELQEEKARSSEIKLLQSRLQETENSSAKCEAQRIKAQDALREETAKSSEISAEKEKVEAELEQEKQKNHGLKKENGDLKDELQKFREALQRQEEEAQVVASPRPESKRIPNSTPYKSRVLDCICCHYWNQSICQDDRDISNAFKRVHSQRDLERNTDVVHILSEYTTYDTTSIEIQCLIINDGFRSISFQIPASSLDNFIERLKKQEESVRSCIVERHEGRFRCKIVTTQNAGDLILMSKTGRIFFASEHVLAEFLTRVHGLEETHLERVGHIEGKRKRYGPLVEQLRKKEKTWRDVNFRRGEGEA
ncbi:hypothetical protein K458DRAFT_392702 [Lentithecium fluviatile CBS 122367]|uniref:Uncharacterized protein n=1 Tax=Lentithecium fluviatile CBS 122367 TaxID=1168545 RepID=A0A6G1IRR0_9PLEO|nr:hypothetical protein K458DRAFT_392702 [Lentithecium fluviatile CBS 122367]